MPPWECSRRLSSRRTRRICFFVFACTGCKHDEPSVLFFTINAQRFICYDEFKPFTLKLICLIFDWWYRCVFLTMTSIVLIFAFCQGYFIYMAFLYAIKMAEFMSHLWKPSNFAF